MNDRIKIDYTNPIKITLILSEKKGVYINHELEESQYFGTNGSYVRVFFKLLNNKNFSETAKIVKLKKTIEISEDFIIEETSYKIKVIYENNPIRIRKIKILTDDEKIELGFFDHNDINGITKNFFSMANPYLN